MSVIALDIGRVHPKQDLFLRADTKHIGFGGARGGGKSHALRLKAMILCAKYAGIRVLILRRTYPELLANHISVMVDACNGFARYNKTDKIMTWINGSVIKYGYCDNDSQIGQYQGQEYDVIMIDEATQFKEEWIRKLIACLRGTNAFPKIGRAHV